MTENMQIPALTLRTGATIPQLGIGTYLVPPEDAQRVVEDAIEIGYRHFDTAQMYHNEKEVGRALAASGLKREEYFLTTKLDNGNHRRDDARRSFDESLEKLGVEYVDLFLIHWPARAAGEPTSMQTWRVLEEFHNEGRSKAIGLSNFFPHHMKEIIAQAQTLPHVTQIESHPYLPMGDAHDFNRRLGIVTQAWSPLARGRVVTDETLTEIGAKHGKTATQVALRWALDRGDVVFPKSLRRERMEANGKLFDFQLSSEDHARIAGLDEGEAGRCGSHPDTRKI
ncbi:MAG: aldo/keto reductase [Actinomycetaceae bacterium]|nr:aldo/keto reductase [Actinomycetaceae bacterium]